MKLWIRSQERDLLEECNRLAVQSIITPNKKHQTWGVISNFGCVGEYATRERCLEIIDEIQSLFVSNNKVLFKSVDISGLCQPKIILYQMPEE